MREHLYAWPTRRCTAKAQAGVGFFGGVLEALSDIPEGRSIQEH